jgi:glycosyltransferase involved in cell wall biosynthesis
VDSGSSDGTPEIARCYTDKLFDVPWRGFGPQKQAAVERASHDMVLNVDCDERVTPALAGEIDLDLFDLDLAKLLCRNGSAHTTCYSWDWTAAGTLPFRREIAGLGGKFPWILPYPLW